MRCSLLDEQSNNRRRETQVLKSIYLAEFLSTDRVVVRSADSIDFHKVPGHKTMSNAFSDLNLTKRQYRLFGLLYRSAEVQMLC